MATTPSQTGVYRFIAALDSHDPVRDHATGTLEEWTRPDGGIQYRIPGAMAAFKDAQRAVYLADDGRTVRPLYVCGWSGREDCVYLEPFPVDFRPDGSRRMRADDPARPVDHSTWMLGPRRAYHLKITRITDKEG